MQTRLSSFIESVVNTATGFIISILVQLILFPALGIEVRLDQNVVITIVFTAVSIARSYVLRRVFNKRK